MKFVDPLIGWGFTTVAVLIFIVFAKWQGEYVGLMDIATLVLLFHILQKQI